MSDEEEYEWNSYTTLEKKNFASFFDIDFSILYRILPIKLSIMKIHSKIKISAIVHDISLIYVTKIPTDTILE